VWEEDADKNEWVPPVVGSSDFTLQQLQWQESFHRLQ
jgi:hypothetical protein